MHVRFEVTHRDGAARTGRLTTPHGEIETPAFMPVGTLGAVKGVTAPALEEIGAQILLSNLYHLSLRPGIERLERLGGLHAFTGWRRPILTDSGGFQVWSLAHRRELDPDGVTFKSHVDGETLRFTPEDVVDRQRRLGVDVAMVLDECPAWPVERAEAQRSWNLTRSWAERSLAARERLGGPAGLFGIVQGSVFPELRQRAAAELSELPFDGFAIGGVSVGEPGEHRREVVEVTAPALPEDRPRYLMGVGYTQDILHAVLAGVDLFDCVLPARNARHGHLFTRRGVIRIKGSQYRDDPRPIEEGCRCPACTRGNRALVCHLMRSGDLTGAVLATLHNLTHYLDFMGDLRQAIKLGHLTDLAAELASPNPAPEDARPESLRVRGDCGSPSRHG